MEQLQYNLLFRWFVGSGMNDEALQPLISHFVSACASFQRRS
jgi:transposase